MGTSWIINTGACSQSSASQTMAGIDVWLCHNLGFSAPYPHVSFSVFIAAYCSPPNYPVNGSVHSLTGTKLGSTLRFSCDQGYRLIGQSSATCTRTAQGIHQWNAPVPLCQGKGPTRAAVSLARCLGSIEMTVSCKSLRKKISISLQFELFSTCAVMLFRKQFHFPWVMKLNSGLYK